MSYTPIQDHAASVALQDLKVIAQELEAAKNHLYQAHAYDKFAPTVDRLENQIAALIGRITLHRQRLNEANPRPRAGRILHWDQFTSGYGEEFNEDGDPV